MIAAKIMAGITMFAGFSNHLNAAWQQSLSEEETTHAVTIVLSSQVSGAMSAGAPSERSRTVQSGDLSLTDPNVHPLGVQILLVELREKKNASLGDLRLAEVFLYNYPRQTTELHLINLDQGVLLQTTEVDTAHLPLSDEEIEYSKQLVFNHDQLTARVNNELSRIQGVELGGLQQRVSVWVPTTRQAGSSGCENQRCALLSLFTANEQSLVVEPVVNLISGDVFIDLVQ